MNRKTEIIIFFSALLVFGVVLAGGITYFKTKAEPDEQLADLTALGQAQSEAVEVIPTSTIITTTASSSNISLPPLTLPYVLNATTATSTYWPKFWGNISFTDNGNLALIPDPGYHGADSFLQNDASWTDYAVSATASSLEDGWFDVVARTTDNEQSFVYCEFGSNGTEAIERVDGIDTQLARTSASTTAVLGASENFGIKVYGDDIACTMAGQEVLAAHVSNGDESPAGGIGFVIFGAPPQQKQVVISKVSVTAFSRDTITVPFPVPIVAPPVVVPPPAIAIAPASTSTTPGQPAPASAPTPAPSAATTTKTLPYATNTFSKSDGWNTWWGDFSVATDSLNIAAASDGTSGGVLLAGTNAWDNYTFSTSLDWVKGQNFGLYARYTDAQNYTICVFTEPYLGDVHISLEEHVNGNGYTLAEGDVTNYNQWGGDVTASIQVLGTQGTCSFDNNPVSSAGEGFTLNPPFSGEIGFTTWDPSKNNAQLIVNNVDVEPKS